MNPNLVIDLAREAVFTILKVSVPIILTALIVGLLVSILQATTQIQEQTLAFVPKIIAAVLAIIFFGPWILTTMYDYAYYLFNNLYRFIG